MHDQSVRSIFLRSGNRRKVATFDLCGGGGRPDRSIRSAGPIDFGNDRSDPPVSSERPREIPVGKLQQKRPPRPIPAIDRSDRFFCGAAGWGRGATGFFGGRGDRSRCRAGLWIIQMGADRRHTTTSEDRRRGGSITLSSQIGNRLEHRGCGNSREPPNNSGDGVNRSI